MPVNGWLHSIIAKVITGASTIREWLMNQWMWTSMICRDCGALLKDEGEMLAHQKVCPGLIQGMLTSFDKLERLVARFAMDATLPTLQATLVLLHKLYE